MNKLLLTTALLSIGSFSASATVPDPVNSLSEIDFNSMHETLATTSVAVGLHKGDVQAIARIAETHLYKGDGSSLMSTIRRHRY
ncbi:MAG: hypothetical protein ABJ275_09925 [Maricaulaceae bacterium]